MDRIVAEISNALLPILQDTPFAFFGHSMGAHVAFMTALHLKENYKLQPVHFFVSSSTPPHYFQQIHCQNVPNTSSELEEYLFHFIKNVGGTPKELLENKELLEMTLPILKADIQILINSIFVKPSKTPISCDITCFSGTEDIAKKMEDWQDLTSESVETHKIPGNHFYLTDISNEAFLINYITRCLEISYIA